jgi:hypothetical protein
VSATLAATHMSGMTTDTAGAPVISELAQRLNAILEAQDATNPFDTRDRCDRCPQQAQARFVFSGDHELLQCGYHLGINIAGIMASHGLTGQWIEPSALWKVKGVKSPRKERVLTGDGLTGS